MQIDWQRYRVEKNVPLTISRGTQAASENLWIRLEADGIEGWGSASVSYTQPAQTIELLEQSLKALAPELVAITPWEGQSLERLFLKESLPSAAWAALDMARHDWLGKRVGLPLWKLWGLDREAIVRTTLTIGISSPEDAVKRLHRWQTDHQHTGWKVKLGNPKGIDADKAMLEAILDQLPKERHVMVDANGGWSLSDAKEMSQWLADRKIQYIEQPLPIGQEADLPALRAHSPLPLFADESCMDTRDIPKLRECVDGINIKLLKCGGITEALRMIHTAKACGLQVMFGCFSESSLSIAAATQLSPMADYLDLDSHLNLANDPFTGLTLQQGRLIPGNGPGLGIERRSR